MTTLRLTVPVGTRPEIIKLAPVIAALKQSGHRIRCVATGQHYDAAMYFEIFAGVGLTPDATWQLSGSEGERLGQLLASAFHDLATQPADAVLVLGDTYTAPLFAMAARRFGAGVIHLGVPDPAGRALGSLAHGAPGDERRQPRATPGVGQAHPRPRRALPHRPATAAPADPGPARARRLAR